MTEDAREAEDVYNISRQIKDQFRQEQGKVTSTQDTYGPYIKEYTSWCNDVEHTSAAVTGLSSPSSYSGRGVRKRQKNCLMVKLERSSTNSKRSRRLQVRLSIYGRYREIIPRFTKGIFISQGQNTHEPKQCRICSVYTG